MTVSMILLLGCSSAWGRQVKSVARRECKANGRVASPGDRFLTAGSPLCPGDRINPVNGHTTVMALCYLNGKILDFKQSKIFDAPDECVLPKEKVELCTGLNPSRCKNTRGSGEEQNVPTLISPYGSSMLSTRPPISWSAVSKATSYTVVVSGYEFYWETTVDKTITTLSYPEEEKELQFGNTYKFTVLANVGDTPTSSSEPLVVSVLTQEEQNAIAQRVKQINKLGLHPDEAAISDLDAIYMSRNLLNETIETLKALVSKRSQNPAVYRLLAERYLEAWLPNEALREYAKAAQLAKSTGNSNELNRVQEGLKIIECYHKHKLPEKKTTSCPNL